MLMEIMEINIYSYPACMHRLGVPARLEVTCDNNVVMLVHSVCATLTITMHRRCMEKKYLCVLILIITLSIGWNCFVLYCELVGFLMSKIHRRSLKLFERII
jgi:hypothetical protein